MSYILRMTNAFGSYVRHRRETLRAENPAFSLRQVAERIGVEPSYLSKVERGEQQPPSEAKVVALAHELSEDPDVLLALAGDLQKEIRRRPKLFARLIRELKTAPDQAVERIVREVRDGRW